MVYSVIKKHEIICRKMYESRHQHIMRPSQMHWCFCHHGVTLDQTDFLSGYWILDDFFFNLTSEMNYNMLSLFIAPTYAPSMCTNTHMHACTDTVQSKNEDHNNLKTKLADKVTPCMVTLTYRITALAHNSSSITLLCITLYLPTGF